MSVYPNPSCSECDQAVHVYCVKKNDEKFKLLEQAHCAKCWKPLYYNTSWPGSHESLRPPFYSPLQPLRLSVAQCGHIYHTQCIVESRADPRFFLFYWYTSTITTTTTSYSSTLTFSLTVCTPAGTFSYSACG